MADQSWRRLLNLSVRLLQLYCLGLTGPLCQLSNRNGALSIAQDMAIVGFFGHC